MNLTPHEPWWRDPVTPTTTIAITGSIDDRTNVSYWAVIAFTFVLLIAPQTYISALAPFRIALLSAAVAILTHALHCAKNHRPVIEVDPALRVLFYFLLWTVLTIPFSKWPGGSVSFLLELFLKTVILFTLLTQVIDTPGKLKGISIALALMTIPLAGNTVINLVTGAYEVDGSRVAGYGANLTANPNDMALMLNLLLPICISVARNATSRTQRAFFFMTSGLVILGVISTFSRAGFLTLVTIGLCYGWSLNRKYRSIFLPLIMIVALTTVPLLPSNYVARLSTITNIENDATGSAQVRLNDMKSALRHSLSHPIIGAGVGLNQLAMNDVRGETWTEIHNVFLQILVELGAPGLILFLIFYWRSFRATDPTASDQNRSHPLHGLNPIPHIRQGLRISLMAFFVAAMFHPVAYHFYFYIIAGLAVAAGRLDSASFTGADND